MKYLKEKYKKISQLEILKTSKLLKEKFEKELCKKLKLTKVFAPLVVEKESGMQDDLSGIEKPVAFEVGKDKKQLEVVQSLAKWKRVALLRYGLQEGSGIITDMRALQKDDKIDQTHSICVDQWDWEKVISKKDRTDEYLKSCVKKIVEGIYKTSKFLRKKGFDVAKICKDVYFITAQELLDMYPDKTPKMREELITKKHKTVFIMQIGWPLSDGKAHDLRAPDYDDWLLDGDLLFYDEVLDKALEITSMGIRVDEKSLQKQCVDAKCESRLKSPYHKAILQKTLPLSIGGGIGQSRLCILLLKRAHIGEVMASYWDKESQDFCKMEKIDLL